MVRETYHSGMIVSRMQELRFEKERREKRKLTYEVLTAETHLAVNTLARMLSDKPIERVDGNTLSTLCWYFNVGIDKLLVYIPDEEGQKQPCSPD